MDRNFIHHDLTANETDVYLIALVNNLIEKRKILLDTLVREKYRLHDAVIHKINEYCNSAREQAFESFFDAKSKVEVTPEMVFSFDPLEYPAPVGKVRRRIEAEAVKGLHSPSIHEELFNKCQKVRAERRRKPNSNQVARRVYLLSGILTCKHRGRRLRAQSSPYNRYYRRASRFGGVDCAYDGKSMRADEVEAEISKLMESLVLPENWQATFTRARKLCVLAGSRDGGAK